MAATTASAPHTRRSLRELRLEQIAIWGDAAAYRTPPTASTPPLHPSPPRATRLPRAATLANANPSRAVYSPFDDAELDFDAEPVVVTGEGFPPVVTPPQPVPAVSSGSMKHVNSRSADHFRRSGSYAAMARAAEARHNSHASFVDRPRSISITAATPRSERAETREARWSDALFADARRARDARRDSKLDLEAVWDRRRGSIERREKDENEFRNSNAKLPERLDSVHVPPVADGLQLRKCRAKLPVLGRYTRSRASQLPRRTPRRIDATVDGAR